MKEDIGDATRLKAIENCVAKEITGETVLLNLENGTYYGLDATGTVVWHYLETGIAFGDLITALQERYGVRSEALRDDIRDFLVDLAAHELVKIETYQENLP